MYNMSVDRDVITNKAAVYITYERMNLLSGTLVLLGFSFLLFPDNSHFTHLTAFYLN